MKPHDPAWSDTTKSPDSQSLQTTSPRSGTHRLHLRHHATEIQENKINVYACLSTHRKNRTHLQLWILHQHPSNTIDNIQISSLPSSTTNQPINGGTTSRKESAPQTVSSIEGGTPFEQGVSSKEPHLNTVLHWIALEKEVTAWRNNSKKFECFMILCFWSPLHLVP